MQNFYIFLDLDGVVWDIKTFFETKHLVAQKSIEALNTLLKEISKQYIPIIIITSLRRINKKWVSDILSENGLDMSYKIDFTEIKPFKTRSYEIYKYLENKNDAQNYLIIDDVKSKYKTYFDERRIIKTSLINSCLDLDKIKCFLEENINITY